MKIDFSQGRVTLVASPVDMRAGFRGLSAIAASIDIPVERGGEYVVFTSKSRTICKVIFCDARGSNVITRYLHKGRFERFLMSATGPAAKPLTAEELAAFLDGEALLVARTNPYAG